MRVNVVCGDITKIRCDVLIVNEFEGVKKPGGATGAVDKALKGMLTHLAAEGEIDGKLEKTTVIHTFGKLPAKKVVVVGMGKAPEFDQEKVRVVAAAGIRAAKELKGKRVATIMHGAGPVPYGTRAGIGGLDPALAAQAVVEGSLLAAHKSDEFVTDKDKFEIKELILVDHNPKKVRAAKVGAQIGEVLASSANKARDLINGPANLVTPSYLAKYAINLVKQEHLPLKVTVLSRPQAAKLKMQAFLSVAQGSQEEPKVIVIKYNGGGRGETIGLVGKGITFDSGGISIKPANKMWEMKTDMSGAAAVIAALRSLAKLRVKKNVIGIIMATENMPSGGALKPGDIIGSMAGHTIEIISTDAEGRLILADGLVYAKKLGAKKLIDIATLTGGCVVALGEMASGLMGNNDPLIEQIKLAAEKSGEKVWPLPLYEEYETYLKTPVADIKNCSESRKASPSTGGIFLKKFVGDTPWGHLDIAGTSFLTRRRGYLNEGATGVGVRMLVELLRS